MDSGNLRVELGERSYDIIFDAVDSPQTIAAFAALPQKNVLISADSNTAKYLPVLTAALEKSGKTVYSWVFPAGESSKNIDNAMALCGYASSLNLGRNALFAALGGGVTGDLTGFAASIFMRGVDFIQIPTSLLAMVDSSVGGKTAVDTPYGKNLAGAFHQPRLVIIDCDLLQSLPAREFRSGLAEIIKTALILDADFAEKLYSAPGNIADDPQMLRYAVKRSCQIKAMVVSADEKESGDSGRVFLNYGHTFGHAVEHLSNFRLAHGEAVAAGMDMAAFMALKLNLCDEKTMLFQYRLLQKYSIAPEDLPASALRQDTAKIIGLMKGDKKNGDGRFRAVLPLKTGMVKTVDLDPEYTRSVLDEYYSLRLDPAAFPSDERPLVGVAGLGLLGSSLIRSLDRRLYRIAVWNRNQISCRLAVEKGLADTVCDTPEDLFACSDIVVLALPIPVTEKFIRLYHDRLKPGAVVTDVASVKRQIMDAAESFPGFNFVGSHPMAGTEKSGFQVGFKGLYDNADVFVVPGRYSTADGVAAVEQLWQSLHTHIRRISSAGHDALVAHTSHMLHIIASALTASILDRPDAVETRRHYSGCATGFRDTSRIASSSPEMWKEICMANTGAILPALDEFSLKLNEFRQCLEKADGEKFAALFRHGRNLRDSWLCYKNSHRLPENIVLCGIKHCGKTTVGNEMAAILDIPLTDTDREIEKLDSKNRTCREIFAADGEENFRKLEAQVLTELIHSPRKQVIALGGGALSNPLVSDEVKKLLGFKVWLDTDEFIAFERIKANGLPPFLADEVDPLAAFCRMNTERKKLFEAWCDVRVVPDGSAHRTALYIFSLYKDHYLL